MDIKIENLKKSETKLIIKLDDKEYQEYEKQTAARISSSMKISGFREGKAPLKIVKEQIGKEKFISYLLETAIPHIYSKAIQEKKLTPISHPKVKVLSASPLEIEAIFAIIPEINLEKIEKIKIKAPKIKISKEDVKKQIERLQKQHSTFKDVTRAIEKGDRIELDFEGFDTDKKALPNTKSKNHPMVVGEGGFIPGFEDNLIGLKEGEEKEFQVTFPKDYHAANFQNKDVIFKIKINKIQEVTLPELNEEFIEKVSGKKQTKTEFEEGIKHDLEHQEIHHAQAEQEEEFFTQVIAKADFEVSDLLINEEKELIKKDLQRESLTRGMDFDSYTKMMEAREGMKIEEIYSSRAGERVKLRFVLDKLINKLKLKASKEEIEKDIKKRLEETPESYREKAKEYYIEGENGYQAVKNEIILNKLYDNYIERGDHSCDSH